VLSVRRLLPFLLCAALLIVGSAACVDVRGTVDELRSDVAELSERSRFCLALARTLTAIESGSPDTAAESAEEVLAQAPADVRERAAAVADTLRDAQDRGGVALDDPELRAAAEELRDRTRELCDPRAAG
jgi:hypothetical protein